MKRPRKHKFTYKTVKEDGSTDMLSKHGWFREGEGLHVGKHTIPFDALLHLRRHGVRMAVRYVGAEGLERDRFIEVGVQGRPKAATKLQQKVNEAVSRNRIEARQEQLREEGRSDAFQSKTCGHCGCAIDLTDRVSTPEVQCPYCETLQLVDGPPEKQAPELQRCPESQLMGRVQSYSFIAFFILPPFWQISHKIRYGIAPALRKIAWRNLLINTPFLILAPFAICQVIRTQFMGRVKVPRYRGLTQANAKAVSKQPAEALRLYQAIVDRGEPVAAVRFNQALLLLQQERLEEAREAALAALTDCANFELAQALYESIDNALGVNDAVEPEVQSTPPPLAATSV